MEAVPFFHVFFTKSPNPWPSEDMVVPATRLEWRHWSSQPLCTLRCRESPLGPRPRVGLRLLGGWGSSQDLEDLRGYTPPRKMKTAWKLRIRGRMPGKGKESEAKHHDFRFKLSIFRGVTNPWLLYKSPKFVLGSLPNVRTLWRK